MRVMGIDYGEQRMGIALSDPTGYIAMPLRVIEVNGDKDRVLREIVSLCKENDVEKIIIGMPVNMNGSKGMMAIKVEEFVELLKPLVGMPVGVWDERLSTQAAERVLLDADMSRKRRKQVRDKLAAQLILQGYLDAQNEEYEPIQD